MKVPMSLGPIRTLEALDGKRLMFNGGELYYTSAVTEAEARALGAFLVAEGFYKGQPTSLRVHKVVRKDGPLWRIQVVTKADLLNDPKMALIDQEFAHAMSAKYYGGAKVEVAMCDALLREKKLFVGERRPGAAAPPRPPATAPGAGPGPTPPVPRPGPAPAAAPPMRP